MRYAFGSQARSRFIALALLGAVLLGCVFYFRYAVDIERRKIPGFDISGDWEFHNSARPIESWREPFMEKVTVPNPLPANITTNLAEEFWYRKEFNLPPGLEKKGRALFIGSIKGEHEIYWNGKFLGGGSNLIQGIYRIPEQFLTDPSVSLTVRVKKMNSFFPGIVHMDGVVIGPLSAAESRLNQYYFGTGVKPLLSAALKMALFFVFIGLFASVPRNREYFSFAIFCFLSSLSAGFYSRFIPGYEDFYFRESFIFVFSTLSIAIVPMMTADLLRLSEKQRSHMRMAGQALALIFLGAALMAKNKQHMLNIFSMSNSWMPLLVLVPSAAFSFYRVTILDSTLFHRKAQIATFAFFLLIGLFALGSGLPSLFQFRLAQFRMFLDLAVTVGLGVSLAMDFKFTAARSLKAGQVVPKWFSGMISGGVERVTLELPLIVIAVDTAGYTRTLVSMPKEERDNYHARIRERLAILTEEFGAQKISERGDGGIFAWDFPVESSARQKVLREVLAAARSLGRSDDGVIFRVGISAGTVRGEMRQGDISFLGEPLNSASRLEGMAECGSALVDGILVSEVDPEMLAPDWKEAELKGVLYRARPLQKSA